MTDRQQCQAIYHLNFPFVLEQSLQTELEMKDHAWEKDSPTLASSLSSNCVYFQGKLQTLPTEYFWDQDHATSSAPGPTQPVFHGHKSALDLNQMSLTRTEGFKSSVGSGGSFMSWCLRKQSLPLVLMRNAQ